MVYAGPLVAVVSQGMEVTGAEIVGVEVLVAYIDPGVAGFVIVTVLGFLSSVGYLARSYVGRVKQRLFGRGQAGADGDADGEACEAGNADDEGETGAPRTNTEP